MTVAEVWVSCPNTLSRFRIKTKDIERTVSKLVKKGYRKEDMMIVVPKGLGYIIAEYDPHDNTWFAYAAAIHPVTAAKHNICNAYTKSWDVQSLNSLLE